VSITLCARDSGITIAAVLAHPQGASAQPRGFVQIQPAHAANMCLDVAYMSVAHGANVIQGSCWNGRNQQWDLYRASDPRYFFIKARHSYKCLDVANMSTLHGADVIQGDCWGGANQQWKFVKEDDVNGFGSVAYEPVDGGRYRIVSRHSGKCLDVANMSIAHGADVIQGNCWNPGYNQRWTLKPTS
jgi:hypothetical protein